MTTLVLATALPGQAAAQNPAWFPARDLLPSLPAGPREPVNAAKLILNAESPNAFDPGFEGEAALGVTVPLLRLAGEDARDALVFGVEAGVFGRFSFHLRQRDLISSDWVFTTPLVLHRGVHWLRLRYHHLSSHLGDEYAQRFEVEPFNFSRDAVDLLAYLKAVPLLGVYGGGNWAYNTYPDGAQAWALRIGAEVVDSRRGARVRPYGALDVQLQQEVDWDPRINVQVGGLFPGAVLSRDLRLAFELLTGPSPQGQFIERKVTHLTFGVYLQP